MGEHSEKHQLLPPDCKKMGDGVIYFSIAPSVPLNSLSRMALNGATSMNTTRGFVGWPQFLCSHSCFDLVKGGLEILLDEVKIIGVLEFQPDMRTSAKPFPESQCGLGGDGAFPRQNLGYPVGRYMEILASSEALILSSASSSARILPGCMGFLLISFTFTGSHRGLEKSYFWIARCVVRSRILPNSSR